MKARTIAFWMLPSLLAAAAEESSALDKLWGYPNLYQNNDNPYVQSVKFTGRFQLDYARVEADQGDHEEWNIRRLRLGGKLKVLQDVTLNAEADLDPQDRDPTYVQMTDLNLVWRALPDVEIIAGKQRVPFTMDGATSSRELLTIDRNNLSNNLWFSGEYITGLGSIGRRGNVLYRLGAYSSGEENKGFGEMNAGHFGLASLGYDFAGTLRVKEAVVYADYVHQQEDEGNDLTRKLANIASLNGKFADTAGGIRTDITAAEGYLDQSNLWGFMLMPFYNLTEKLQAVVRYTYLESEDPEGVRLARYEREVVTNRGDEYQEYYAGLNYYIHGHSLKLQTGLTWAEMKDSANAGGNYDGWACTTGLRIGW